MACGKEDDKGIIFDIQGFSVHDGPGCRTLFFFSGCPLTCLWCANPEGQTRSPRLLYRRTRCSCSDYYCMEWCPHHALQKGGPSDAPLLIDRSFCERCTDFSCVQGCYREALAVSGKSYAVSDVMAVIERDKKYWGKRGGVTFGGGDPLMQYSFLKRLLMQCRNRYIHSAVETSAFFPFELFYDTVSHADWVFIDIKHMDPVRHREGTGVANNLVLANIRALKESSWHGRLMIRVPVIPGFNDDDGNIRETALFLRSIGIGDVNLLPFHRLGESKYAQLGEVYHYADCMQPDDDRMEHLKSVAEAQGIDCYLGYHTPF